MKFEVEYFNLCFSLTVADMTMVRITPVVSLTPLILTDKLGQLVAAQLMMVVVLSILLRVSATIPLFPSTVTLPM